MGKTPNFQKWAFQILSLLVVAIATFSGEALISTAAPLNSSNPVPVSCALEHTPGAGTKIFFPSSLGTTLLNDLGGSGTSSKFSLNCSLATIQSPNLDPNGHTFTVGGVTYDHMVSPDGGSSPDILGSPKPDGPTRSTFRKITVNNPSQDKVTWNFTNLHLPPSQNFTFAIHTYQDTAKLNFKLNGGDPIVGLQTNKFQVVYSSKSGVNTIVLDFSDVSAGTIVQVGDFFVGHTSN